MRAILLSLVLLGGCAAVPSFYDDNESLLAVNVRYAVSQIECTEGAAFGVAQAKKEVEIFSLYSESKKSSDIGELVEKMKQTVDGLWEKRKGSAAYCNLKKKVLAKQSADIANAVMRRF